MADVALVDEAWNLGLWHSQLVALSVVCQGVAASWGAGAPASAGDRQSQRARLAAGDVGNYTVDVGNFTDADPARPPETTPPPKKELAFAKDALQIAGNLSWVLRGGDEDGSNDTADAPEALWPRLEQDLHSIALHFGVEVANLSVKVYVAVSDVLASRLSRAFSGGQRQPGHK